MGTARVRSIALQGVRGSVVEVEADIASGLPHFSIVGLPDAALGEARDRVRAAVANSQLEFPRGRIVVNLTPATLRKAGSAFDLAIAVCLLVCQRVVSEDATSDVAILGELGLDGRLRPTRGVLPSVLAARDAGLPRVLVPTANRAEAALVDGIAVMAAASLRDAAILLGADLEPVFAEPVEQTTGTAEEEPDVDLADVVGQPHAVRALIVAAAGRHNLLLTGPPGAGKSMLAARLPGILPDLDDEQSLQVTALRSLAGRAPVTGLVRRPPWEAPHHSATMAALLGGGAGPRPGAVSLASWGVLFLDEAGEFRREVLDSLRQSLESGEISIHRANAVATFPARFQLVLAMNPCPCGGEGASGEGCTCTPQARRRYRARLSGPLLDRVDIQMSVGAVSATWFLEGFGGRTDTAGARGMVMAARAAARERWKDTGAEANAAIPGADLRGRFRLPAAVRAPLDRALERGALSLRGYDRVTRVAWSCADLRGVTSPGSDDVAEALFLRQGGGS